MIPASPEAALARWLADGVTSLTHPVLDHCLRTFFAPLGIEADWLEAEVFGDLENGGGGWWLRGGRWRPAGFDRTGAAAADFMPLLDHPERFLVGVGGQGHLRLEAAGADPAAQAWLDASEAGWRAIRHSCRAAHAAEAFIYAAAGAILASDPASSHYANGRADRFCQAIAERLEKRE
jgi:hypothetical protein